jgi:rubredoxin
MFAQNRPYIYRLEKGDPHELITNQKDWSDYQDLRVLEAKLKKWAVEYFQKVKNNVVSNLKQVKNYFLTMDIWSQPSLAKLYLGVFVKM